MAAHNPGHTRSVQLEPVMKPNQLRANGSSQLCTSGGVLERTSRQEPVFTKDGHRVYE